MKNPTSRPPPSALTVPEADPKPMRDFSDSESQRVLTLAARVVAYELGRQAAREFLAQWQAARLESAA
jgi:hypothetical protein